MDGSPVAQSPRLIAARVGVLVLDDPPSIGKLLGTNFLADRRWPDPDPARKMTAVVTT